MNIYRYQCVRELTLEHPEYKNLELIYLAQPGQSFEATREGLRKAMDAKGKTSTVAFQIGDLIYIPKATVKEAAS